MLESTFPVFIDNLGILKSLDVPVYGCRCYATVFANFSLRWILFLYNKYEDLTRAVSLPPAAAFPFPRTLRQNSICAGYAFSKLYRACLLQFVKLVLNRAYS
jgi:hypothetical protein